MSLSPEHAIFSVRYTRYMAGGQSFLFLYHVTPVYHRLISNSMQILVDALSQLFDMDPLYVSSHAVCYWMFTSHIDECRGQPRHRPSL